MQIRMKPPKKPKRTHNKNNFRFTRVGRNKDLLNDLIQGYLNDEISSYCSVKIRDIYVFLRDGSLVVNDSAVINFSKRFILHPNGIMTYDNQRQRLVIPRGITRNMVGPSPVQLRSAIMYLYHDMSCHVGVGKLMKKLVSIYWWANMASDILRYVRTCKMCCFYKGKPSNSGDMGSTIIGSSPFHVVLIDFATVQGRPVLVMVDSYSNYVIFSETSDQTALSAAEGLWKKIICQYGTPSFIHSDLGTSFVNEVIAELKRLLKIDNFIDVNPYSPRTQGLVERYVGIMKSMLNQLETVRSSDFNIQLKFIQLICNIHESPTHTIPFELVFNQQGRNAPDP